jgi:hypothetical protein
MKLSRHWRCPAQQVLIGVSPNHGEGGAFSAPQWWRELAWGMIFDRQLRQRANVN